MDRLRTPDAAFRDLPDHPFAPVYLEVRDPDGEAPLRMHVLDEGARDGRTVLLLHGEPTWSYLYRHMIPPLVEAGCRVVVPDLIGFGRSDKPVEQDDHTYARQVAWLAEALFEHLDLTGIVLEARIGAGCSACGWSPSIRTASPASWRATRGCRPATGR